LKLSSYVEKGFHILSLVIPVKNGKEYILTTEDRNIDNMTELLSEKMKIKQVYEESEK